MVTFEQNLENTFWSLWKTFYSIKWYDAERAQYLAYMEYVLITKLSHIFM